MEHINFMFSPFVVCPTKSFLSTCKRMEKPHTNPHHPSQFLIILINVTVEKSQENERKEQNLLLTINAMPRDTTHFSRRKEKREITKQKMMQQYQRRHADATLYVVVFVFRIGIFVGNDRCRRSVTCLVLSCCDTKDPHDYEKCSHIVSSYLLKFVNAKNNSSRGESSFSAYTQTPTHPHT